MTKANQHFLAKLASITIGTGHKPTLPPCAVCGGQLKAVTVVALVKLRQTKPKPCEEQSFAA